MFFFYHFNAGLIVLNFIFIIKVSMCNILQNHRFLSVQNLKGNQLLELSDKCESENVFL